MVALTNDHDRSVRPLVKYGRGDPPFSSEPSVETQVMALEKERSPRQILKLIGPTIFSAEWEVGGRGVTDFFGGRGG
jgi:hypothetical protein